ncbi:MAG: gamma-glutamyl-gamma-aminobutyrate hydrolase family protein [Candidatus Saccharimonadales bacterium]
MNGGHQQAIKTLSKELQTVAVAEDGIIEAFEGVDYPFLVGVQFHPELRLFDPPFAKIFDDFVAAAAAFSR